MRSQRSLEIEERLQTVLELIQGGQNSTSALAAEFGVSIPTAVRCIAVLGERGHDLRAVRRLNRWRHVLKSSLVASSEPSGNPSREVPAETSA
jgi:hypothetical protein